MGRLLPLSLHGLILRHPTLITLLEALSETLFSLTLSDVAVLEGGWKQVFQSSIPGLKLGALDFCNLGEARGDGKTLHILDSQSELTFRFHQREPLEWEVFGTMLLTGLDIREA